jgi:hypothetical protein
MTCCIAMREHCIENLDHLLAELVRFAGAPYDPEGVCGQLSERAFDINQRAASSDVGF